MEPTTPKPIAPSRTLRSPNDHRPAAAETVTGGGHVVAGAAHAGAADRGWFVGHFMGPATAALRATDDVEVKWGQHAKGERRAGWALCRHATTLSVLVAGKFRVHFADGDVLLARPGDYVLWAPGVAHAWEAEEDDTVVFTVRWPSRPGDSVTVPDPRAGLPLP